MAVKLMYIPNDDTQNYPSGSLKLVVKTFEHNELTNQKSPKLLCQRVRKSCYKTLGTSEINSPLSPLSLGPNLSVKKL